MDPNDPILIQQHQHQDNLRRQQQLEQQRRLEHQQLLEDEEREQMQQEQRARALATPTDESEAPHKKKRWPFGGKKNPDDQLNGDGETDAPELLDAQGRVLSTESAGGSGSAMGVTGLLIALILVGVLAWLFLPRLFKSGDGRSQPVVAQTTTRAELPQAAPGDPLSTPTAPGLPELSKEPADQVNVPGALPAVSETVAELSQATLPQASASTASAALPALAVGTTATEQIPPAAAAGAQAGITPSTPQADELNEVKLRLSELEVRMTNLQSELDRRIAEASADKGGGADGATVTLAPRRVQTRARLAPRKPQQAVAAKPKALVPAAIEPSLSAEQKLRNQMQAQLLSIDVWDGVPSIVVGTGAPGDKRIRTLQPGEQLNGVALQSVDVPAGRATFSVGSGSLVTLDVKDARQP